MRHEPTFFIDKCLGTRVVPDALRACGVDVEIKTDHFADDTPDVDWLPVVGEKGWIILSKDKQLRHNYLEIVLLLQSGAASFILTSGNYTGQEMANAYVEALPAIKRMQRPLTVVFLRMGKKNLYAYSLFAKGSEACVKASEILDKHGQQGRAVRRYLIGSIKDKLGKQIATLLTSGT